MAVEIPAWVEDMPLAPDFNLTMYDHYGGAEQEIDLTRDEYIALKAHLAAMRGYTVGDFQARIADLATTGPEGYRCSDLQQIASHLETARDFYRHCPDLVVFDSDELAEYIEDLAHV